MKNKQKLKELIERQQIRMRRWRLQLLKVLCDQIVQQGVIVSQVLQWYLDIEELAFVHLRNARSIVHNGRVGSQLHWITSNTSNLNDIVSTRRVIRRNHIQDVVRLIFDFGNGIDALLLDGHSEIVSVLHTRNLEGDPHFDWTAENDALLHFLFHEIQNIHEVLCINSPSQLYRIYRYDTLRREWERLVVRFLLLVTLLLLLLGGLLVFCQRYPLLFPSPLFKRCVRWQNESLQFLLLPFCLIGKHILINRNCLFYFGGGEFQQRLRLHHHSNHSSTNLHVLCELDDFLW